MGTFSLIKSESRPVTRELATEFRDMPGSPTERKLSQRRLDDLEQKAAARKLVTFHWATAELEGKKYRVNGQHSSHVLSHLNGSFPDSLTAHIDHYKVDDKYALVDLFRMFDSRTSSRTAGDVAGAFQVVEGDDLKDVKREAAKIAIDAIAWHRNVQLLPVPTGDDKYSLMGKVALHPFVKWYGELTKVKATELRKVPIVAAMYATFSVNQHEATKFWERVAKMEIAEGDDHSGDPAAVLDLWLVAAKEKKHPPKPAQYYQAAIFAWNAHRQEKTITEINAVVTKGKQLREPLE